MMKWLLVISLLAVVGAAPQFNNNGISPAMRQVMLDMLKSMMRQSGPSNFKLEIKPPVPPPAPPASSFRPPPLPPGPPRRSGNGLLMDMPNSGGAAYGGGAPMMRNYVYCPPGPTSSDSCKDQKLMEALYFPDGTPRYNWVPPRNPWDTSIPDTVKDTEHFDDESELQTKQNSNTQEWELMSLLGDPKEQGPAHTNPFAG